MRWPRVMVVGVVACLIGCAGCESQGSAPGSAHGPATAGTGSPGAEVARVGAARNGAIGSQPAGTGTADSGTAGSGTDSTRPLRAPWPEREILPEDGTLLYSNQVLDLSAGMLYVMVPTAQESRAPSVLEAIDLSTGKIRRGEAHASDGLALESGYPWVYGASGPHGNPVLDELGPRTLGTIRSVSIPAVAGASVWAAVGGTLLRVSVSSGAVLARAVLPAGLDVDDLALGPGGMNLYASAELRSQGAAAVLEYSAGTGRLLAQAEGGQLTGAINGAWLTPVPGGVWVSFRTGMLGASGLLSARSLTVIYGFTSAIPAVRGIGTIYAYTSGSPSAYGGGALWVATSGGLVACVNPATGRVRAEETVPLGQAPVVSALAVDGKTGQIAGVVSNWPGFSGVVTITPPRNCWG